MDYETYTRRAAEAAAQVDAGQLDQAVVLLKGLIASGISDLDKSVMWVNVAIVQEKAGRHDDALAAYDEAVRHERGYYRHFATESRAAYLHRLGRVQDSLREYETLLRSLALMESDKDRLQQNVAALRQQLGTR